MQPISISSILNFSKKMSGSPKSQQLSYKAKMKQISQLLKEKETSEVAVTGLEFKVQIPILPCLW